MTARPALLALGTCAALLAVGCAAAPTAPGPLRGAASPSATASAAAPSAGAAATPTGAGTPSPTASATPAPGAPSITLGAPAPSPVGSVAGGTPQGPSLIAVPPGGTAALGLANAFHADGWREGDYQPAAAPAKVPALAATVNCGQPGVELEYRFSPTTGTLTLALAQDVLSDSSDNTVGFSVLADGKSVAEKAVAFKQTAQVSAPLAGVTVVKIVASAKAACRTSSTALITSAIVSG